MFQRKTPWEIEWSKLEKKERKFLNARESQKENFLNQKLDEKIPVKLQETLHKAFAKAFLLIFEKGTGVIEKSFRPEEMKKDFRIKEFTNEIRQNKKSLRAFGKKAETTGLTYTAGQSILHLLYLCFFRFCKNDYFVFT